MTLDLYIAPLPSTGPTQSASLPKVPVNNFTFMAQANQPFSAAINTTLKAAFPGIPISMQINPSLISSFPLIGIYGSVQQFADYINKQTFGMLGASNPKYQGVQMFMRDGTLVVTDGSTGTDTQSTAGTTPPKFKTVNIAITDLIGQPTWVGNNVIQVTTVQRGDIQIGDSITLPKGLTTITAAGVQAAPETFTAARWSSQFQGTLQVAAVRHVGHYKAPAASAWVSVFTANQKPGPASASVPPPNSKSPATPKPLVSVGPVRIVGGG